MRTIKKKSILSFVLIVCMLCSMLPSVAFADVDFSDYTYADSCVVNFDTYGSVDSSILQMTSTTMQEVNAGLIFDSVFVENPKKADDEYAAVNYYAYYNSRQQTSRTFDRSTTVSSIIWGAEVNSYDENSKEITEVTLSLTINWTTHYGFFYSSTGDADDNGTWPDGSTDMKVYYSGDYSHNRMETPVREGYIFKGWYYIENGQKVDTTYNILNCFRKKTNYPVWALEEYNINYELNGGQNSSSNPAKYTYNVGVDSFENPTKDWNTFDGWYLDADFNTPISSISATEKGDITIYAKWIPDDFTVTFDANGGLFNNGNSTYSDEIPYGSKILENVPSSNPQRSGYNFAGWVDADGNELKDSDVMTEKGFTAYASWEAKDYKLSFDLTGGEGNIPTTTVKYGDKINANLPSEEPTKTGYTFTGWVKADGSELTDSDVMTENGYTVYASWKLKSFALSFDLVGGIGNIPDVYIKYGDKIKDSLTPILPTKVGYTFNGWVKQDGSELTDNDVMGEDGYTVYANWEANGYELSFDLTGGEGDIPTVTVKYGDKINSNLPSTEPTKIGYTFAGWVKADGSTLTDDDVMTENGYVVYASWTINSYELNFDLAGGEGDIPTTTVKYGDKINSNLPSTEPTKTGYTFNGWVNADGNALTDNDVMSETGYTLYASWLANEYELNFDLVGGEGNIPTTNVKYGDKINSNLPSTQPTKTGYTFTGWVKVDGSTLTDNDVMDEKGYTLYASWEVNGYELRFDLAGGEGNIPTTTVKYGDKINSNLPSTEPTKVGYTFAGWVNADGSTLNDNDVMDEKGYTLYASWTINSYELSFDLTGGEGNIPTTNVKYGDKINSNLPSEEPTKTGYTFNGWVKADGSTLTDNDVMSETGYTLYASWLANEYELNFDLVGGEGNIPTTNVKYGDKINSNLPSTQPTKTGYTFTGWVKVDGSTLTDNDVMDEKGYTLYASWKVKGYELSFDLAGGEGDIPATTVKYGDKINSNLPSTEPTKTGYTFAGWVKQDGSTLTDDDVMSENGYVVYASWTINSYELNFDLTGGEGNIPTANVKYGDKINSNLPSEEPTKTGYTFNGWVKENGSELTDVDVMSENGYTVYASWLANEYELNFDLVGGEGNIPTTNVKYGDKINSNLPEEKPTKTGYTFIGWVKENGSTLTDNDVMDEKGYTLYASWEVNGYELSFDLAGGEGNIPTTTVKYGDKINSNLPSTEPTKVGYTFAGWVKVDGSTLTDDDVMSENGYVVYASWTINSYELNFDLTGGEGDIPTTTVKYGDKINSNLPSTEPTKTGYTFNGWVNADGNALTDNDVMSENGYTVYASWLANEYELSFDLVGGTGDIPTTNVKYGDKINSNLPSTEPTKTGYTFIGWVKVDGSTLTDNDVMDEKGYTLYASWEVNGYKLSFDLAGGEGNIPTTTVKYGDKINSNLPSTEPTKVGYTFAGWVKQDGSTLNDNDVMSETGYVVYASWTINSYELSFDLIGGTGNIPTTNVKYGDKINNNLPSEEPTKTGYTFNGWIKADGNALTDVDVMSETGYTLYASWLANEYELSFDLVGGEGNIPTTNVKYGDKINSNLPSTQPTKTGYTFTGWVKENGSALNDNDVMDEKGYTLYASWEVNGYELSFDLAGGEGDIPTTTVKYGDKISENLPSTEPTKTGYTFAGWVKENGNALTDDDVMSENGYTLYASWTINSYELSFDLTGGEGDIPTTNVKYGDKINSNLPSEEPTKTGYTFNGWVKVDGSTLTNDDVMSETGYTLYASWLANEYELNFDLVGGEGNIPTTNVKYGDKINSNLPSTEPTKTGYTFTGWVKVDGSALTYDDVMTETGYTLYASWKASDILAEEQIIVGKYNENIDYVSINQNISNGTGKYTFALASDQKLPSGVNIDNDGNIYGKYMVAGKFVVNVIVTDANTGATTIKVVKFEIAKADVNEVVFPVITESVAYGTKLSDIKLEGKGDGVFEWVEPDTIPEVKNNGYAVKFIPNDNAINNYNYGDDFKFERNVNVTVTPIEPTLKTAPTAVKVTKGSALKSVAINGGICVGLDGQELKGNFNWKESDEVLSSTGEYKKTVVFTPDNANYKTIEFDVSVTVNSASSGAGHSSSSGTSTTYTIEVSCSNGGSISPSGKISVSKNDSATFTFEANDGYEVSSVLVDGEKVDVNSLDGKYVFNNVNSNHSIYVEFKKSETTENVTEQVTEAVTKSEENTVEQTDDVQYIQGYPDGSFKPSKSLTRAEATVVLANILNIQPTEDNYETKFSDVKPQQWFYNYVSALTEKGIINGYPDGTFRPNDKITRAEMVTLVVKALGLNGEYASSFSDISNSWAKDAIAIASAKGWINGYSDGTFRPNDSITRAETVVFLNNVIGVDVSTTVSESKFTDVKTSDWFFEAVMVATGNR